MTDQSKNETSNKNWMDETKSAALQKARDEYREQITSDEVKDDGRLFGPRQEFQEKVEAITRAHQLGDNPLLSTNTQANVKKDDKTNPDGWHFVSSSGGTQGTKMAVSMACALHYAGIHNLASAGGPSGGAIGALMIACGFAPSKLVRLAVETDVTQMLKRTKRFTTGNISEILHGKMPVSVAKGVVSSEAFCDYVEEVAGNVWPESFWTLASAGKKAYVFDSSSVHVYRREGNKTDGYQFVGEKISDEPAPLDLVLRATIAVPGIIESVKYNGVQLYDGALTGFGHCPTEIPVLHGGARKEQIIGVNLSKATTWQAWMFDAVTRTISGTLSQLPQTDPTDDVGLPVKLQRLPIDSLDFSIDQGTRKEIMLAGFAQSCRELHRLGVLNGERMIAALEASKSWSTFEELLDQDEHCAKNA